MTSEKKSKSNRANARKSTGPKTAHGKRLTRFNALKLGAYAISQTIPGEDPELYAANYKRIFDTYGPLGPIEREICGQIAHARWLLRRLETARVVALKRANFAIVTNDLRISLGDLSSTEEEIDYTLLRSRQLARTPEEYVPPTDPTEEEAERWWDEPVEIRTTSAPIGLTFLKGYTSKSASAPCSEIESQIRASTNHLLRLDAALRNLQEERRTVRVRALGGK